LVKSCTSINAFLHEEGTQQVFLPQSKELLYQKFGEKEESSANKDFATPV
jgi:hypothetical protein